MVCHTAVAFFNVDDAAGRSAGEAADELIAQQGFSTERSGLTIASEEAVMLANVPGQASMRQVLFVHDERLYTLSFVLPEAEDFQGVERFERRYSMVINSFTFLPTVPSLAPGEASQGSGGSAVVVFVEGGDILVWEETSSQTEIIFESRMEQKTTRSRFNDGYTFQLPWGSRCWSS